MGEDLIPSGRADFGKAGILRGGSMDPTAVGLVVLVCVFAGALLGVIVRSILPEHHLSTESKDVVKLGMGLIGTMAALILGLLIASAKGSYDTRVAEVIQLSANIIVLDRIMAHYGPETKDARDLLRRNVARAIDRMWPERNAAPSRLEPTSDMEVLLDRIEALAPQSEAQRSLRAQALGIAIDLGRTRWLLFEQSGRAIPLPFLVLLVCWLVIIFGSFGLFARPNPTLLVALFVCALSAASAIFLILELDQPFAGVIQISSTPMREALGHLGR